MKTDEIRTSKARASLQYASGLPNMNPKLNLSMKPRLSYSRVSSQDSTANLCVTAEMTTRGKQTDLEIW
jgi:hypothetical protein